MSGIVPTLTATLARIAAASPAELEQVGVALFAGVAEVEKTDPAAGARVRRAVWDSLTSTRREAPCALDADFVPTENARDPRTP